VVRSPRVESVRLFGRGGGIGGRTSWSVEGSVAGSDRRVGRRRGPFWKRRCSKNTHAVKPETMTQDMWHFCTIRVLTCVLEPDSQSSRP